MKSVTQPALLSDELEAMLIRDSIDDWKPRTLDEIITDANKEDARPVRIYADGVYDLFHHGHADQLRQAKNALPNAYLIVGVCSDADTLRFKGRPPVMSEEERCETVRQCRYVDEVCRTPPFFPTLEFVNSLKVDLVAHDALPYLAPDTVDCYAIFKECNRFLETKRTPAVSTTDVLGRILSNVAKFQKQSDACKAEEVQKLKAHKCRV
ncbi:Protein PCYT-1 b [Aphelenchoides avenae]|nr:Protein PCYT-1 b [Aphelenchus avenae]